jgi:uncharacterized protein YndB with AHSA1/START domain
MTKTVGALTISASGDREIQMIRVFDAPRHLVFDALTKPELLRRWFNGPPGWTLTVCEFDPRPGGAYRYVWSGKGKDMGMGGVILEFVPPLRIVATEKFDDPWYPGEGVSSTVLTEEHGRTTMTMTVRYESREARDAVLQSPMEQGVAYGYDQLAALLATLPHDPPPTGAPRDLVVTRDFDAPVARAWKAWSEAEYVMKWWGPTGFSCPIARMDFREGGVSLVCMRAPEAFGGQDMYSTWTYTEIVPHKRIDYVHNFADSSGARLEPAQMGLPPGIPGDVRNVIEFAGLEGGRTRMTITEYGYTTDQARDLSKAGLEQCLDKMAAALA